MFIISVMFFIAGIQYSSEVQYELTRHHKKYSDRRAADVRLRTYTDISRVISFLVHFRFDASQPGLMFMWEYGDSEEMCVNCHHHTGFNQSLHLFWIIAERVVIVQFVMFVHQTTLTPGMVIPSMIHPSS